MQPIYILEPLSAGTCEIQVPADGRAKVGRETTNEFSFPHDLQMSSVHFEIGMESEAVAFAILGAATVCF